MIVQPLLGPERQQRGDDRDQPGSPTVPRPDEARATLS
jgi:hypothetical protein